MILRLLILSSLCFAGAAGAPGVALSLGDGEHLSYRVSWAIIPGAGEIKVDATRSPESPDRLVISSRTETRRVARMLLPFKARSESIFDLQSGRLVSLHEHAVTRGKTTEHTVAFDYEQHHAVYDRIVPEEEPRVLPMPDGNPVDLMLALLQTRTWNLQPGDKRDALVLFDDDFYELTLYATGYEEVRTPLGTFRTLVLEPRMEKTPPKGMFKRGSTVRVWIAQDDHRLPVRFEVEFKIGTGTATLDGYRPPNAAPAGAGEATGPAHATDPRP